MMFELTRAWSYAVCCFSVSVIAVALWLQPTPPEKHNEAYWVEQIADDLRLEPDKYGRVTTEHRLADGTRCDIVTDWMAIEVDWAEKWAEGIGQSLFYGFSLKRRPVVILLVDEDDDRRYVKRLNVVADRIPFGIWIMDTRTRTIIRQK